VSSFFDAMIQGLGIVENHVLISDPNNDKLLRVLEALEICMDDLHDLDHKMKGAINRHPVLFESFRYLLGALDSWYRTEKEEDSDG